MKIEFLSGPLPLDACAAIRHNTTLDDVRSALITAGFSLTEIEPNFILAHRDGQMIAIKEGKPVLGMIEGLVEQYATTRVMIHGA